jgi:CheY-like chemotaxis protein
MFLKTSRAGRGPNVVLEEHGRRLASDPVWRPWNPMTTQKAETPHAGARILLVDDNQLGLAARKIVLEELGYAIVARACAQDALEEFARQTFQLVVTDFKMPEMDGLQLIQRLREANPEIPIVLISGFADTLGLDESSTGADIVIQKSNHEVSSLIRAVQRLLSRKARRKPPASQPPAPRNRRQRL